MTAESTLSQMGHILLLIICPVCVGSFVELALTDHTGEPAQFIPFILCVLGSLAAIAVWLEPERRRLLRLRRTMLLTVVGSLFGIFEHFTHNLEFEREANAAATAADAILAALTGNNPMQAPGILLVAAALGLLAVCDIPAWQRRQNDPAAQKVKGLGRELPLGWRLRA